MIESTHNGLNLAVSWYGERGDNEKWLLLPTRATKKDQECMRREESEWKMGSAGWNTLILSVYGRYPALELDMPGGREALDNDRKGQHE